MGFFTDPTVTDLISSTIKQVEKLEDEEQLKLLKRFRIVRRELLDRLLTIPDGTFTEQQLNVTLIQINAAIGAIVRDLKIQMPVSANLLADKGAKDLEKEVQRFSQQFEGSLVPLNIDRIRIAQNTNNFLVNKYEASLDAYGADLRSAITGQITNSLIARDTTQRTVSKLVADVGRFFQGEEWKLRRIARTELHNVYNFSKLNTMKKVKEDILPDLQKSMMHPMDDRTGEDSKKLARENPIVDIDEPFVFTFKGKTHTFMFPPGRPNDRAILVPFRKTWDVRASFSPGGKIKSVS